MTSARPATLAQLRAYAIAHSLFKPTTLPAALRRMGFVQADPIRAPSRAQDLILRHRVAGYRDGDLERRYARLDIEEDALHNYGVLSRELQALLHPREVKEKRFKIERSNPELFEPILEFVRANGATHPRDLDPHHGGRSVTNYWGGSSSAATHVLDILHYRGALRIARRDNGVRVYTVATHHRSAPDPGVNPDETVARLIARVVDLYAPVPAPSLRQLATMLRYGAPHLERELRERTVLKRAVADGWIGAINVDGLDWYLPADDRPNGDAPSLVRLLAPFDPVVWDRARFELFWGWAYRFEAYTPTVRRKLGYYALPMLWRDAIIGWANVAVEASALGGTVGFVAGHAPRDRAFGRELERELARMRTFLGL
jgi:uncharacterized protein YcaQ